LLIIAEKRRQQPWNHHDSFE